eukprot:m.35581 g.35581  ORF g.35581 m.35581 type:complete len:389 (+) comp8904_c0_seq1:651-1817(+)
MAQFGLCILALLVASIQQSFGMGADVSVQWESLADIPIHISDASPVLNTKSGLIYLAGGCAANQQPCDIYPFCTYCPSLSKSLFEYNPLTNTWTALPDAPRARTRHATAIVDGVLYLLGGRDVDDALIALVDTYDIASKTWSTLNGTWAGARSDMPALVFKRGEISIVGGYDDTYTAGNSFQTLDIQTETWAENLYKPMSEPRADFDVTQIHGKFYVVGGWSQLGAFCIPIKTGALYDPVSNEWTALPELALGRGDAAIGSILGQLFIIGGEHNNNCTTYSNAVNDVEVLLLNTTTGYGLAGAEWSPIKNIPESKFRFHSVTHENKLYLFGGQSEQLVNNEFPVTNHTWVLEIASTTTIPVTTSQSGSSSLTSVFSLIALTVLFAMLW